MNVGLIGLGVVGSAVAKGLQQLNHTVAIHDIKLDTSIQDVLNTDVLFICVPSPSNQDGSCNTSVVESVINELDVLNYRGIVAIKTTVPPGFTEQHIEKFKNLKICFVPEFLRERCALDDFVKNHEILVVGTHENKIYETICLLHGHYPKNTVMLSPSEAEILKYYNNLLAALRITIANVFYEVCQKHNSDYSKIKNAYVLSGKINDLYLDVNENLRGFGGICLPKDTEAFNSVLKSLNLDYTIIDSMIEDNKKFKTTVFDGMRLK